SHRRESGTLCEHDSSEPLDRRFHLIVHDDVVVAKRGGYLLSCDSEPAANRVLRVLAAPAKPLLQSAERRRKHEDRNGGRNPASDLAGALDVDHEYDVLSAKQARLCVGGRGAVEVPEEVRPFEKGARGG